MKIGILGFQGSIEEHEATLHSLEIETYRVKTKEDLNVIDGLILPGGESTHMLMAMKFNGLYDALKEKINSNLPIFATCAGVVLLSRSIENSEQESIGVLDAVVSRNGYGPQYFSFIEEVKIEGFKKEFRAVFIRAPIVRSVGTQVKVLARDKMGNPIFIKQNHIFGLTFHPELTKDDRLHKLFIETIH
ncbi:MAG: pyridoxal 5'-phosphate synthase glutaminase subunit PdxT [Caldisericia bacterium]|nr:pyridoxal 5'-phosphate synthase glutaminase subunit PdxT [Caldisericia bacterium]